MKYTIKEAKGKINVVELNTDQIVKTYLLCERKQAQKLVKHLNSGGGFAGNTPPFVLSSLNSNTRK